MFSRRGILSALPILILITTTSIPAIGDPEAPVVDEAYGIARHLSADARNGDNVGMQADLGRLQGMANVPVDGTWSEERDEIIDALVGASTQSIGSACLRPDILALAVRIATGIRLDSLTQSARPSETEIRHHITAVIGVARTPFTHTCHIVGPNDLASTSKLVTSLSVFVDNAAPSPVDSSQLAFNSEFYRLLEALIRRAQAHAAANLIGEIVARHDAFPIDRLPAVDTTAKYIQIALLAGNAKVARQLSDKLAKADFSYLAALSPEQFTAEIGLIYTTTLLLDMKGFSDEARRIASPFEGGTLGRPDRRAIVGSQFAFGVGAGYACRGAWQAASPHLDTSARLAEEAGSDVAALRAIAYAELEHVRGSDAATRLLVARDALTKVNSVVRPPPLGTPFVVSPLDRMRISLILGYELLRQGQLGYAANAFEAAIASNPSSTNSSILALERLALARVLLDGGAPDQAWSAAEKLESAVPPSEKVAGTTIINPDWYELQAIKLDILMRQGKSAEAEKLLHATAANSQYGLFESAVHIPAQIWFEDAMLADPSLGFDQEVATSNDDIANQIPLFRLGSFARALLAPGEPLADDRKSVILGIVQAASATQVEQALSLTAARLIGNNPQARELYAELLTNIQSQQAFRVASSTNRNTIGQLPYVDSFVFPIPCSPSFTTRWTNAISNYLAHLRDSTQNVATKGADLQRKEKAILEAMQAKGISPGSILGAVPVGLGALRAALRSAGPHTALVQFTVFPQYTLATVVTDTRLDFFPVEISRQDLTGLIQQVLSSAAVATSPFNLDADTRLSELLLQRVMTDLDGVIHLVVVPSGSLESLPFALLRDPGSVGRTPADSGHGWLIDRFAISVMPGIESVVALQASSTGSAAGDPARFIGFGAPVLEGEGADCQTVLDHGLDIVNGLADVDQLRRLCPVWSLESGLQTLATLFNGQPHDGIYVERQATETRVKQMSASGQLRTASVFAFATHGNLASRPDGSRGYAPPGLILTPPATATEEDDGYLTTAEIGRLDLNADWVLLTACDTATSDGSPGAEALSGITKAFMFAGARAVLVSHWGVDKDASEALVVQAAANAKHGQSRPDALRNAMISLRSDKNHPEYRQPYYWAAFSDVGM